MYLLPRLEVNGKIHVRSTYALYFGANLKLLYDASCHLTLGASKIGNKLSSLSYCLIWIIGNVDFVDCNFWCSWLMCTFVAMMLVESCLVTHFEVNPGHIVNWEFLMDLMEVECTGMKQEVCRYDTRFVFVSVFELSLKANALALVGI